MTCWVCTVPPITTSTDSWATTGNQTVVNGETPRLQFNAWARDTTHWAADGITGIFDIADVCESTRNSGKWAVSGGVNALGTSIAQVMTDDGIHPLGYGNQLMAAASDFTRFT